MCVHFRCGKSQILRFIKLVCPRVVLTSGIGTTGAGLTCSVTRDGNDWSIEAGALVLANGGVCCIDEFSSIANHDRAVILEAMEQQTISIAKAGVVSQLEARTTVIATCNPKGIYDLSLDLSTNTAISTPLLSRFDLTLVLLDRTSKEWDQKISTYLLQSRLSTTASKPTISTIQQSVSDDIWDTTTLREYIQYAKTQHHPKMSVLASHLVMKYFYSQRQVESSSATKATTRLLESLIRLSQAHAKLLLQDEVLLHDAVTAIFCVSLSQTENRMSTGASILVIITLFKTYSLF